MSKILVKFGAVLITVLSFGLSAQAQVVKAPIEVPFEFVHNQIVVQAKIGGKGPFNLLVDTNTDPSAIDTATARELGLQIGSNGASASGGGTEVNNTYPTRLAL